MKVVRLMAGPFYGMAVVRFAFEDATVGLAFLTIAIALSFFYLAFKDREKAKE